MSATRTPIRRKAAKPKRTTSPRCERQRCAKRAEIEGMCVSHAEAEADARFSRFIRDRDGGCTAVGMFGLCCFGALQAAHIIGRRKMPVRYDPENVHALCQKHHMLVDQHSAEAAKYRWSVGILGEDSYDRLMDRGLGFMDRRDAIREALAIYEGES